MSNPAASGQNSAAVSPRAGLMLTSAGLLAPIFMRAAKGDAALAGEMALAGIEDYQPATRADYVNLARTIAFSMASIALLGHAASADMTVPERMRAFGRANALSRSADQSERTMMQRRHYQQAYPGTPMAGTDAEPELDAPAADLPGADSELQASIADAMKEYLAVCAQPATEVPNRPEPASEKNPPQTAAPQPSRLTTPVEPPKPGAMHFAGQRPCFGEPRTTPDVGRFKTNTQAMTASRGRNGETAPA